jgi:hypothetical protein
MKSETFQQIRAMFVDEAQSRPSPVEYEMAYHVRVVSDRIRFAIRQTELTGCQSDHLREAAMQLLDALDRLEEMDRRFQSRSRVH